MPPSMPLAVRRSATAPRSVMWGMPRPPSAMSIAGSAGTAVDPATRAAMRAESICAAIALPVLPSR
jgi:hypothetical protein